ncbi:MAG: hypothetical protein IH925_02665 [Proteobacteria bacterium]|nr:hypothetical protein [Pseudomonadota bacterium]
MIKRSLIAVAVAVAVSSAAFSPAQAFYCPKNVKAIDAALGKSMLSADQKSKVKGLRDKGLAQHKAGDHKGAVKSLAEAVRIILNNM